MKLPAKIGIVVFLLVLLSGAGMWFWTLGAVASEEVPPLRIEVTHAPVELKRKDETEWKKLDTSAEAQIGDSVRTGEDGLADIRWGDRGVSRIDPSSELTIEAVPEDVKAATNAVIRLRLSGGRVWTRLLKLLDVSSDAEVTTGNVVATVRGTAFGVEANNGADIAVTESVVAVGARDSKDRTLVREGRWGHFSVSGTPDIIRNLTDEDGWAQDNHRADIDFDEALRLEVEQRFKKRQQPAPDWVVELSERAHLATSKDDAESDRLRTGYARRRLADAVDHPEQADRLLSRLPDLKGNPEDVLRDIRLALVVNLGRPDRRLSDALQNLRGDLLGKTDAARRYSLALTIDDRIDEIVFPARPLPGTERAERIATLLKDIADWENGNGDIKGDEWTKLGEKAAALRERLAGIGELPPPVEPTPSPAATSTESGATSTPPVTDASSPKPAVTGKTPTTDKAPTPPPAQPTSCGYTRVTIFAKPNSGVNVGDKVSLSLFASCPDGKTDDVTSRAIFSAGYVADGTVGGASFVPSHGGTIKLYGTLQENGKTLSANTSVTVNAATAGKKLTGVTASTIGATTLTTGQGAPVQGFAQYSDGSKTEVTYQCKWSTSDARMGLVSNQRFQSLSGTGTVSAICSYTEGGTTLSGGVAFTIILDPALTPSGGKCVPNYQTGKYCP